MKKFLAIIIFTFALSLSLFAQAVKVDEIGRTNAEDWAQRLDVITREIAAKPTSKAFVIIHRGLKEPAGDTLRLGERLRNYLRYYIQLTPNQFEILIGTPQNEQKTEIWIVSPDSEPPLKKSFEEKIDDTKNYEFDDFSYPTPYDGGGSAFGANTKQEKNVSVGKFAELLKANLNSDAYIIFYGQYCKEQCIYGETLFDSTKTINSVLRKEKNYLIKNHNIEASRIKTINGGYREWQAIELWLVPKGEKPPKPTPETFPKRRIKKKVSKRL